jgi:O-acetyl-ADP-ribose deacetylase (regulator of RNase III)
MKIIFFDMNKELVAVYQKIITAVKLDMVFITSDVNALLKKYKFDAIISPANSFGKMTGGIDKIYKDIFQDIEKKVKNNINTGKLAMSNIGPYLPVGQNIVIETGLSNCNYMIIMPTMFLPKDINGTQNVYLAFYGLLQKYYGKNLLIACPGLGTGIGALSPTESATQILQAINDYLNNNPVI